jgi:hypothetical protein
MDHVSRSQCIRLPVSIQTPGLDENLTIDRTAFRAFLDTMKIHQKYSDCRVGEGVIATLTPIFGSPFPIEGWDIKKILFDGFEEFVWVRMA